MATCFDCIYAVDDDYSPITYCCNTNTRRGNFHDEDMDITPCSEFVRNKNRFVDEEEVYIEVDDGNGHIF